MAARHESDPASVGPEWQEFFQSLKDPKADVLKNAEGPSWQKPNWPLRPDGDLVARSTANGPRPKGKSAKKFPPKPKPRR